MPTTALQDAWIRDVFGVDPASYDQHRDPPSANAGQKKPDFGAAARLWAGVVAATEKDLHAIRQGIVDAFDGDDEGQALEREFLDELNACIETLDLALHDELRRLEDEDADHTQDQVTADARKLIDAHVAYLQTDAFMKSVDENPFGVKIVDRLDKALKAIERVFD